VLASLTGDAGFLGLRTGPLPVRVDSNVDVPAMVYEHALICEYAHARLCQLREVAALEAVFRKTGTYSRPEFTQRLTGDT
jgi:hypothetical protein